jgi:hypothetical protein
MKGGMRGGYIAIRKVGEENWQLFNKQEAVATFLKVSRPMVSFALYKKFKKTGNVLMGYEIVYVQKGELK